MSHGDFRKPDFGDMVPSMSHDRYDMAIRQESSEEYMKKFE